MIVNRLTIRELAEGAPQPPAPTPAELSASEQRRLLALAALADPEQEPMPEEPPVDG